MKKLTYIGLFLFTLCFYLPIQANAGIMLPPPLWEDNFGRELVGLTDCDDCTQMVELPFGFPYNGVTYNKAYVGTNGCIQLGDEGPNGVDYDYWSYMEEFLDDVFPLICPIEADWDLEAGPSGDSNKIYYRNTGNPLVFTWYNVGTNETNSSTSTFQLLIYQDGSIVSNLNGILDGDDEDLIDDLDTGIIVGITPSNFPYDSGPIVPGDPGPNDLSQSGLYDRTTIYARWCYDEADSCGTSGSDTGLPGPINTEFDLDYKSVCFAPFQGGSFQVSSAGAENPGFTCSAVLARPIPTLSEWGLIAMAGVLGIIGFIAIRKKRVEV